MIHSIKNFLGFKPPTDFAALIDEGAVIVDVRTIDEFAHGHIKGSINIERDQLRYNLQRLPGKNNPIITCCATGARSATAKRILEAYFYAHVYDGGDWMRLQQKIQTERQRRRQLNQQTIH